MMWLKRSLFLFALGAAVACGGDSDDGDKAPPKNGNTGKDKDAGKDASRDAGPGKDTDGDGDDDKGDGDGNNTDGPGKDDASMQKPDPDGGVQPMQMLPPDSGIVYPPDGSVLMGKGSCCAEHDTAGCSNADLQVCVCEKDPSCCSKAWAKQCVFLVEQKFCQPGVRECVCGSGENQWGQSKCCDTSWNTSCNTVAVQKCEAIPGCF